MNLPSFIITICLGVSAVSGEEVAKADSVLPSFENIWSSEDYVGAFNAIQKGSIPFPKLSEDNGAKLIRKFTDIKNLDNLIESPGPRPILDQLVELAAINQVTNKLIQLADGSMDSPNLGPETVLLRAFMLQGTLRMGVLTEESFRTKEAPPGYQRKPMHLESARDAYEDFLASCCLAMPLSRFYSKEVQESLLCAIEAASKDQEIVVEPSSIRTNIEKLESALAEFTDPQKARLEKCIERFSSRSESLEKLKHDKKEESEE